jgi:hypothetical protein
MAGQLVVVAGALANKPLNGGEAWVRMSWARGLQRLGCSVWFVEEIDELVCTDERGRRASFGHSVNWRWFRTVVDQFGLGASSSLLCSNGATEGASPDEVREVLARADLVANISGNLGEALMGLVGGCRAFIDLDPGFTQMWYEQGELPGLVGHDRHFSVGMNLGSPACLIPTNGLQWRPLPPPVVLDDWPAATGDVVEPLRFTTVATWRGPFGPIEWDRRRFGLKVHEFRKYVDVPSRVPVSVPARFEAALGIHPSERKDLELLARHHWELVDPVEVAGTPDGFREYVAGSAAEFSVAQEMYVKSRSGWLSDRTTRYLACGRPALVQDTGFAARLPVGKGLVTFSHPDEVADRVEEIVGDYPAHASAARSIAEELFDSDHVLASFLEGCEIA